MRRFRRRDYSSKNYSNDLFRPHHRERRFNFAKLILFLILASFFAIIYLFLFSPWLKIKDIEVSGEGESINESVKNEVWKQTEENKYIILSQKNILIFDKDALAERLAENYFFDVLKIDKKIFSRKISINFKQKNYSLVWNETGNYCYINGAGEIIAQADPTTLTGNNYPLIENSGGPKISGKIVKGESERIAFAASLFEKIKEGKLGDKVEKFSLGPGADEIKLKLKNGPEIYFNCDNDLDAQLKRLNSLIDFKLKDGFYKKRYIDLRYGETIYYQ